LRRADKRYAGRVGLRTGMDSRTLRTLSSNGLWARSLLPSLCSPLRLRLPPLLDWPLGLSPLQLVTASAFDPIGLLQSPYFCVGVDPARGPASLAGGALKIAAGSGYALLNPVTPSAPRAAERSAARSARPRSSSARLSTRPSAFMRRTRLAP